MDAINAGNLKNYFDQLRRLFDEYDFDNHPEAIYNMDETGVPLEPQPPKVLPEGKRKFDIKPLVKAANHSYWLWQCHMPPFITFAAKRVNSMWTKNEVSGSNYTVSDSGWVELHTFPLML